MGAITSKATRDNTNLVSGVRVTAKPGIGFTLDNIDYFRGGDTGTITKVVRGDCQLTEFPVHWDRTGMITMTTYTEWEKNFELSTAIRPAVGVRVTAKPNAEFSENSTEFFRAGDTGTVATLESDKFHIFWDRTGETSNGSLDPQYWTKYFVLSEPDGFTPGNATTAAGTYQNECNKNDNEFALGVKIRYRDGPDGKWFHGAVTKTNPMRFKKDRSTIEQLGSRWKFVELMDQQNIISLNDLPPVPEANEMPVEGLPAARKDTLVLGATLLRFQNQATSQRKHAEPEDLSEDSKEAVSDDPSSRA